MWLEEELREGNAAAFEDKEGGQEARTAAELTSRVVLAHREQENVDLDYMASRDRILQQVKRSGNTFTPEPP